jgi:hypothetical protein
MLLHAIKNMTTKKRGFTKAEKEIIRDNAYMLAREGLLSNYLKKYPTVVSEKEKKHLEQANNINKTARQLKEFEEISKSLSGMGVLAYAKVIVEKNFSNDTTERIDPNYIRDKVERILYDYYDSKIEELNSGRNDAKLVLDEIFKNAQEKK